MGIATPSNPSQWPGLDRKHHSNHSHFRIPGTDPGPPAPMHHYSATGKRAPRTNGSFMEPIPGFESGQITDRQSVGAVGLSNLRRYVVVIGDDEFWLVPLSFVVPIVVHFLFSCILSSRAHVTAGSPSCILPGHSQKLPVRCICTGVWIQTISCIRPVCLGSS